MQIQMNSDTTQETTENSVVEAAPFAGDASEKTSGKTTRQRGAHSMQGSVVSAGADKTITVLVERKIKHPLYKKYIRRSSKLHAHDERNECQRGDAVVIESCRPLSKLKNWRLVKVIAKAN